MRAPTARRQPSAHLLLVALTVLTLAFAGCLGALGPDEADDNGGTASPSDDPSGGDDGTGGNGTTDPGTNGTGGPTGNGTGNQTGNDTGNGNQTSPPHDDRPCPRSSSGDGRGGDSTGNGTNGTGNNTGNGNQTGGQTGNQTGNGTGDPSEPAACYEWRYDNRTGSVSGTYLLFNSPDEAEESFDVENGTVHLFLNLTVDGDDVTFTVYPPGCEEDACAEEVPVADGSASFGAETPGAGPWRAVVAADPGLGPYSSDYTLEVATKEPISP